MKSIYTRFLAIVAVIVLALGCAVVAFAEEEFPYQEYLDSVPYAGVILPAETAVRLEPSLDSEPIGTLKSGTACQTRGVYFSMDDLTEFRIVDLAVLHIDGHETGYGFINTLDVFIEPEWLMLTEPTLLDSTPWGTESYNGMASGLVMLVDKDEDYYAIRTLGTPNGTSFIRKYFVPQYAKRTQNLYVVPISTPIYDDSKKEQIGEIPSFTVVDRKDIEGDFCYVTVNPGTDDELTGWIPYQRLHAIIN